MQTRGKMALFGRVSRALLGWLMAIILLTPTTPLIAQSPTQGSGQMLYLPSVTTQNNITSPDPTEPAEILSDEERIEIISNVESAVNDILPPVGTPLEARDLIAETARLGEELLKIPGVITTITMTEVQTVQVVMADGLSLLIVNNRPTLPSPAELDAQIATAAMMEPQANAQPTLLQQVTSPQTTPGNRRAVVTSYDGGASVATEIANKLTKAGYEVLGLTASLPDMMQYKNLGLLYLDTHSTIFQHFSVIIDAQGGRALSPGEKEYSIQTSTVLNITSLTNYKQGLNDGELTLLLGEEPTGRTVKFAITSRFIRKYWSFDNGMILLHICYGGRSAFTLDKNCTGECLTDSDTFVLDPPLLRDAMKAAGAKAVVSFDNVTNADYARPNILFLFDRLLGQNNISAPNPPLRPFPISQVHGDMQKENLLSYFLPTYPAFEFFFGTTVNLTFDLAEPQLSLAPSIQRITVLDDPGETQGELKIRGNFPEVQGNVTINDFPTTIKSWSRSEIVVNTPPYGNGSAGDLLVFGPVANREGVESNPVPVTWWTGTIKVIHNPGLSDLQVSTESRVSFRADLHEARATLDSTPTAEVQEVYLNVENKGKLTAQGRHITPEGSITWIGSHELRTLDKDTVDIFASLPTLATTAESTQADSFFGGLITLNPQDNTAHLCFIVQGVYDAVYETSEATMPVPMGFMASALPMGDNKRGLLNCFNTPITNDYIIEGGNRIYNIEGMSYRVEWSDFHPVAPPNEETPG